LTTKTGQKCDWRAQKKHNSRRAAPLPGRRNLGGSLGTSPGFVPPKAKGRPVWSGLSCIFTGLSGAFSKLKAPAATGRVWADAQAPSLFDDLRHMFDVRLGIIEFERKRAPGGRPFRSIISRADYSMIFDTTPEPTVRPPSRMAKRSFSSIAIGAISSTLNFRLSPGITISVPSGSVTVPVTSVVRK